MNLPPIIEKELRQLCKAEGFSEVYTIYVLEFYSLMRQVAMEIHKEKGFILQDKKAA